MNLFFQIIVRIFQTARFIPLGALFVLFIFLWKKHRWVRLAEIAHEKIDQKIARDRQNATIYWEKAELYESSGEYERAMRYYRMAHQLCPVAYNRSEFGVTKRRLLTFLRPPQS